MLKVLTISISLASIMTGEFLTGILLEEKGFPLHLRIERESSSAGMLSSSHIIIIPMNTDATSPDDIPKRKHAEMKRIGPKIDSWGIPQLHRNFDQ